MEQTWGRIKARRDHSGNTKWHRGFRYLVESVIENRVTSSISSLGISVETDGTGGLEGSFVSIFRLCLPDTPTDAADHEWSIGTAVYHR